MTRGNRKCTDLQVTAKPKIFAIASAGGHFVQLCRLAPAWDGAELFYVTTDPGLRSRVENLAATRAQERPGFAVVTDANRNAKLKLVKCAFEVFRLVLRHRPDVVVTTGAAPGYFAVRAGKLIGAKTIWIDSIANADEVSLSGARAGRHADVWLTQWPELASEGGPDFWGAVL